MTLRLQGEILLLAGGHQTGEDPPLPLWDVSTELSQVHRTCAVQDRVAVDICPHHLYGLSDVFVALLAVSVQDEAGLEHLLQTLAAISLSPALVEGVRAELLQQRVGRHQPRSLLRRDHDLLQALLGQLVLLQGELSETV